MGPRQPQRHLLLLLLVALASCGGHEGEGALFRAASLAAPARLELALELDPRAFELQARPSLGTGGGTAPRVVVGTPESEGVKALLPHLGVEPVPGGFRFLAREFDWSTDVLVAVVEDPQQPGLPVTLVAGVPATLLPVAGRLAPGYRASLMVLRGGSITLEVRLSPDGRPRLGTLREYQLTLERSPEAYRNVQARGLAARASVGLPEAGVIDYLERVAAARERMRAWAGETVGRPARILLEVGVDELPRGMVHDRLACTTRSALDGQGGQVHGVIIVPREGSSGPRIDDGGAALIENDLLGALGMTEHAWLPEAAAVEAAGSWFGLGLEEWARLLVDQGLRPPLAELLAPGATESTSAHVVLPLRALLVRALRDDLGLELARVWAGTEELPDDQRLERSLLDLLGELVPGQEPATTPELSSNLFGARLAATVGDLDHGLGSAAARLALNDLSATGGRAVLVDAFVAARPGLGDGRGLENERRLRPLVGDVAVCLMVAESRARDLATVLCPHLLSTPEGTFSAGLKRTRAAEWERFFATYRAFAVHSALLARCASVDLLALGGESSGQLGDTLIAGSADGEEPPASPLLDARVRGWESTLDGLRELAGAPITWVAPSLLIAERFAFWPELDALAMTFRPEAGGEAYGEGTRGPVDSVRTRARMRGRLVAGAELAESVGRPWLLLGAGFRATEGAWRGEFGGAGGRLAVGEQQRLVTDFGWAFYQLVDEGRAPSGILVDSWDVDLFAPGTDRGYDLRGKPGMRPVLRSLWNP